MSRRVTKLFNFDIQSVNEADRQITFCFSDDSVDRMGEVVDQASWDVKNYMNNPIILWGHNSDEPENVLGQGVSLDLNKDGKSFITAQFDDAETNPRADMVFRQLIRRTLRCVSAGFINGSEEKQDGTPFLKDNELLEVSIVPIPANPNAIALALKDGSISTKDANWLIKSMRDEAAYVEKQMNKELNPKEGDMEEVEKQLTTLAGSVEKMVESQASTNTTVEALAKALEAKLTKKGAIADELAEDEDQELKWAKMDLVRDMYWAFCDVYYDEATPVDDFETLVAELSTLLAQVADGTYKLPADAAPEGTGDEEVSAGKAFARGLIKKALVEKNAEQTDEEKKAAEDKAAADKEAADKAEADRKAAEEAEAEKVDDDTEVTPEMEAEIDAALEAENKDKTEE
jgi:HK97 family phage prohead protease